MKLLHVVASPRDTESNTQRIAEAFLALAGANTESKYSLMAHQPLDETHRRSWARIEALIENSCRRTRRVASRLMGLLGATAQGACT